MSWDEAATTTTGQACRSTSCRRGCHALTVASAEEVEPVTGADGTVVGALFGGVAAGAEDRGTSEVDCPPSAQITVENTRLLPTHQGRAVQKSLLGFPPSFWMRRAPYSCRCSTRRTRRLRSAAAACHQIAAVGDCRPRAPTGCPVLTNLCTPFGSVARERRCLFRPTEIDGSHAAGCDDTEAEKAEARAPDPRAREIIDHCARDPRNAGAALAAGFSRVRRSASDATPTRPGSTPAVQPGWTPLLYSCCRRHRCVVIMGVRLQVRAAGSGWAPLAPGRCPYLLADEMPR